MVKTLFRNNSLTTLFINKIKRNIKRILNPPILNVEEIIIGRNVVIEPNVEIICKKLILGDGVFIGSNTRIEMTDLVIGDYTKINSNCLLTGTDWCRIGHNCWFGHFMVLDSIGTTFIGDNVGIGAHSQLWTHAYFGDVLEGCRFASHRPLVIGDDAWFVGHCIVSPVHAQSRSMAMVGSVVVKDMEKNHVYAGVPAKDVTDRMGPQFEEVTLEQKRDKMNTYLAEFVHHYRPKQNRIVVVDKLDMTQPHLSQFSLSKRIYIKNLYPEEIQFMRFLLPTKAKFLPTPETDWVRKHLGDNGT